MTAWGVIRVVLDLFVLFWDEWVSVKQWVRLFQLQIKTNAVPSARLPTTDHLGHA